ncbi:hypothetical protein ACR3K2_07130 [Cryptosporidium serpentis]
MLKDDFIKVRDTFFQWLNNSGSIGKAGHDESLSYESEILQKSIIPLINTLFKKLQHIYMDLVESCTTLDKKGTVIISEEVRNKYALTKQTLIYTTRLVMIIFSQYDTNYKCVRYLPLKLTHELLDCPMLKDSITFRIDLLTLQKNEILVDSLLEELIDIPSSITFKCFQARKKIIKELSNMTHPLLPLMADLDSETYFTGLSNNEESIAIALFKVRNLVYNLSRPMVAWESIYNWWIKYYSEIFNNIINFPAKELNNLQVFKISYQLNNTSYNILIKNVCKIFKLNTIFDKEAWIWSSICFATGFLLFEESIIDERLKFNFKKTNLSEGSISIGLKFCILSHILDINNFRPTYCVALFYLRDSHSTNIMNSYEWIQRTLSINICCDNAWILSALLWTCQEIRKSQPPLEVAVTLLKNSKSNLINVPIRFLCIGYQIYQLIYHNSFNEELVYIIISNIEELKSLFTQIDGLWYQNKNLPLILHPTIFWTQIAVWCIEIRKYMSNSIHICYEIIQFCLETIFKIKPLLKILI